MPTPAHPSEPGGTPRRKSAGKRAGTPKSKPGLIEHLYILLDRSGSMASIAEDVIGGFNTLVASHAADRDGTRITLVQFDSGDDQDLVAEAVPATEMVPLDGRTYTPRGSTPLLDATGKLLRRAADRARRLEQDGLPAESVTIVSITDGHENASREYTLQGIRDLVSTYTDRGWTFVFMSANLDGYSEARAMGYGDGSIQEFLGDAAGASMALMDLTEKTLAAKQDRRRGSAPDPRDFFRGDKAAERDRHERGH